jgi:hypothetical protein
VPYFRRLRQPLAWIALVALWAMALLPTAALALSARQDGPSAGTLVCTAQGARRVGAAAAGEEPPPVDSGGTAAPHCPLCLLHGLDVGPPPASAWAWTAPAPVITPTVLPAAGPGRAVEVRHPPRGPPVASI